MINESYVWEQLEALKSRVSILENQMADLLRQEAIEPDVGMTVEEAIAQLKKLRSYYEESYAPNIAPALDMAIRALEEQKTYSEMTKPSGAEMRGGQDND